jgi:hypothetical protein
VAVSLGLWEALYLLAGSPIIEFGVSPMQRRKRGASQYIPFDRRVSPEEAQQRIRERDAQLAADTRTDAEKLLGDPPHTRSALAQGRSVSADIGRRGASGARVDLWKIKSHIKPCI